MSVGTVTFRMSRPGDGGVAELFINTIAVDSDDPTAVASLVGQSPLTPVTEGRLARFAVDVQTSLESGGGYPLASAQDMADAIGWEDGPQFLVDHGAASLHVVVDGETWRMLPELTPLPDATESHARWVDQLGPTVRTLGVGEPVVPPSPEGLAILYQPEWPFVDLEKGIRQDLSDCFERIDTFRCDELIRSNADRARLLGKIFFEHSAVLFLGHGAPPSANQPGGWRLGGEGVAPLSVLELGDVLGVKKAPGGPLRKTSSNHSMPELVFSGSCIGAIGDPAGQRYGVFYPEVFLTAGVRYFVGSFTDVCFSRAGLEQDLGRYRRFVTEFLKAWRSKDGTAVEHLYTAKKSIDFHLMGSLFQIYARGVRPGAIRDARPGTAVGAAARAVPGAVVGSLDAPPPEGQEEASHLGDFTIESKLWSAPYATTFWATSSGGGKHMVQVLADGLQSQEGVGAALDAAVERLQAASLSERHLVPDRHLALSGESSPPLHTLVYDRPDGESPEDWLTLASAVAGLPTAAKQRFMEVLHLGSGLGFALSELHEHGIRHGNLDPASVVLHRQPDAPLSVAVIKDAWVGMVSSGRSTPQEYAAPEESRAQSKADQLKHDCWGLGVVLHVLATGELPFDADHPPDQGLREPLGQRVARALGDDVAHALPESLERVVRQCLVPSAELRPEARQIAARLTSGIAWSGDFVNEFVDILNRHIQAGHRLFTAIADDLADLESCLLTMTAHPTRRLLDATGQEDHLQYHLLVAKEGEGLTLHALDREPALLQGWTDGPTLQAAFQLRDPPSVEEIGHANACAILDRALQYSQNLSPGHIPLLLVCRYGWWEAGAVRRAMLSFQETPVHISGTPEGGEARSYSPVVLTADWFRRMEAEASRHFVPIVLPPMSGEGMFARLVEMNPSIKAAEAAEIAHTLFPCSKREFRDWTRLARERFQCVDDRIIGVRDEERSRRMSGRGTATYTLPPDLPPAKHFAPPPELRGRLEDWTRAMAALAGGDVPAVQRRLLLVSESGCGKTAMARHLAARIDQPLVRFDCASCLRGGVGESEETLHSSLGLTAGLGSAVVLFDDIDRLFAAGDGQDAVAPALARMSGIVLNWVDQLPPHIVTIATARSSVELPSQWLWRFRVAHHLPKPEGVPQHAYRQAIFAAALRSCGLDEVAAETGLLAALASHSDPFDGTKVPSPLSRRSVTGALRGHRVALSTGADIVAWVQETITLCTGPTEQPSAPSFWTHAIGLQQEV